MHSSVRTRRVARPWRIVAFVAATVLMTMSAFVVGLNIRTSQDILTDAEDAAIQVFAAVEERTVQDGLLVQGVVFAGPTASVVGAEVAASGRPVVTSVVAEVGSPLQNRELLGTISDRPLFALSLDVPLYRDIALGDEGTDVRLLQAALGVPDSGVFDRATRSAVFELYDKAGFEPPGGYSWTTFVRAAEIVAFGDVAIVDVVAARGDFVDSENPFVTIRTGPPSIGFRASVSDLEFLEVGMPVEVSVSEASYSGTVQSIGDFVAQSDAQPAGFDVKVVVDADSAAELVPGASAIVRSGEEQPKTLAVPQLAVRQDPGGAFVLVKQGAGEELSRIDVTVLAGADGWAGLEAANLAVGDMVLVAP